jgi:hypothetical protein
MLFTGESEKNCDGRLGQKKMKMQSHFIGCESESVWRVCVKERER